MTHTFERAEEKTVNESKTVKLQHYSLACSVDHVLDPRMMIDQFVPVSEN